MRIDLPPGIGKPATRALTNAGYLQLTKLAKITEQALADMHGVGPKAVGILREALAARGLTFAADGATKRKPAAKKTAAPKKVAAKKVAAPKKAAGGSAEIDAYLAKAPVSMRPALDALRKQIRAAAPDAEEGLTYQVPAFRVPGGGPIVSFGAAAKHCALYVMSPAVMAAHAADLQGRDASKGAIRFTPDAPLPAALVKKLVKARLAEIAAKSTKKKK